MDNEIIKSNDSVLFRMKAWKWLLLLIIGLFGMTLLYGLVYAFPLIIRNVYVTGIISLAGCTLMCFLFYIVVKNVERRPVTELSLRRFLPDTVLGWVVGGGAIVLSVLAMWMAGVYRAEFFSLEWQILVHDLFLFTVVAVAEEIISRGIMLHMIEERWGTTVALVISCLIFGFLHYFNDGGTVWSSVAIAVSAVEAASYIFSRTLWMAIGAHLAWNFTQGNIFGIAVSGHQMEASVIQPDISGPEILTGGAFGAEASVITVVISTAIAALLIWQAVKKGNYLSFRCPLRRRKGHAMPARQDASGDL